MQLSEWRTERSWSFARVGQELGLDCKNPGDLVRRWELGMNRPDADTIEKIKTMTGGAVTEYDMHAVRLKHLAEAARADAAE